MNLEQIVTNLELSRKLKELGVKQESQFYYCNAKSVEDYVFENEIWMIAHLSQTTGLSKYWYSAYTASELLELLPNGYDIHKNGGKYYCDENFVDESLCNCLAKMLIHLIESNLIEPPNMHSR